MDNESIPDDVSQESPNQEPEIQEDEPPTIVIRLVGYNFVLAFRGGEFPLPMVFAATEMLERFARNQMDQMDYQRAVVEQQRQEAGPKLFVPKDHLPKQRGN